MQRKPYQSNHTNDNLEIKNQMPEPLDHDDILYQLDQCDDLQPGSSQASELRKKESISSDESETKNNDEKSFFEIDAPTERKSNNKKQMIIKFLDANRSSLPTTRNQDGNLEDELVSIQKVENQNKKVQNFILAFNKKPAQAIEDYISKGHIQNDQPQNIAKYLMSIQGLDKTALGEYFGKNNENILKILHNYCQLLDFRDMEFDLALRKLLSKFRLPGQAQQIQRVVWEFSLSFYDQNVEKYANADELFPLAYSIIMLATDAHNPKQQRKMSSQQFVKNTQGPCPSIGKQYLQNIYSRITKEKLETQNSYLGDIYAKLKDMDLPNIMEALQYTKELMKGDVVLKICRDNGKLPFSNNKTSKFVQRRIFLSEDEQKINWVTDPPKNQQQPRFILIKDIIDLTLGIAPHLKNKVPKQFDSLCFTITTNYRYLDLKAKSTKERSKWLNYLRAIMIQRRQQKRQQLEKRYNTILSKESVQQAWNGDIFPNWDKYWDYQLKKPKEKGYFIRGFEALCCCFQNNSKDSQNEVQLIGIPIKNNLLETLWKYGLPHSSRKTLWVQIIGNPLELNKIMIEDIKKRKIKSVKLRQIQQNSDIINMAQFLITLRPDLPPIKDILEMAKVFYKVIPGQNSSKTQKSDKSLKYELEDVAGKQKNYNRLISFSNLIHKYHFLTFYRGEKSQIQLRTKLFEFLLEKNVPSVLAHFQAIKLETRMYLVTWFLSIFATSFKDQFLYRIWDNFLLEGELYLFKVGIAVIKYYEIQLKMCTFYEGLKVLKFQKNQISFILFFHILQNEIQVKSENYHDYIQKRKHAVIKTKVQSIPLQ